MLANELKSKNHLHIQDVYKAYGDNVVLDNIDLSVSKGAFVTVIGPSGCGKSTLLRLILGQEQATSGEITLAGEPIRTPDVSRGIVYQKYSLYPHLTVLDNVTLGKKLGTNAETWRAERKMIEDEALHYLGSVKLAEHANKYPHELSGGMQQRVAVMQSLIMKPNILMMDEPFGALDPGTREMVQVFLLERWKEEGMTIFFVTHDLEEALFLGTRIITLSQYYTDDRHTDPHHRPWKHAWHGAKIVSDRHLRHIDEPLERLEEKRTQDFTQLIEEIRDEGFDAENCQHVSTFTLNHENSFQTLTAEEST